LYIKYPEIERMPLKELKAFRKVSIGKGKKKEASLAIPVAELQKWDEVTHAWKLYAGNYEIYIGKNANEIILKKEFSVR
jgi:beta-glucosidase